jgi:hypothetical protein
MKRRSPTLSAAFGALLLAGCASDPPPLPPSYAERAAARPQPREVAAPPDGVVAPVDRWTERLRALVPAPWTFAGVEAQVEAPPGWTRIAGDRGLALDFDDGTGRQVFWVLPRGFDGRIHDPSAAAEVRARSDEFVLFGPKQDRPGWQATPKVIEALELH